MTIDQIIAVLESLDAEIRADIASSTTGNQTMIHEGRRLGVSDAIHEIKMAQIRTGTHS